jgi:hypothetical protein
MKFPTLYKTEILLVTIGFKLSLKEILLHCSQLPSTNPILNQARCSGISGMKQMIISCHLFTIICVIHCSWPKLRNIDAAQAVYWLAGWPRGRSSSHGRVKNFPLVTGGSFPGGKAAGVWSWPPPSAEVKKMWIYTFTCPYVFMA